MSNLFCDASDTVVFCLPKNTPRPGARAKSMRISNYTSEYLRFCRVEKENRPTSIGTYRSALRKIVATIGDISVFSIDQGIIMELKEKLMEQGISDNRRSMVISVLKNFLSYLRYFVGLEVFDPAKITIPRISSKSKIALTLEEIERFVSMLPEKTLCDRRFKALVAILTATGARIGEILGIERNVDINAKKAEVVGKGGKSRFIYWDDRTVYYLNLYQASRAKWDNSPYLFGTINRGYSGKWDNGDISRKFKCWSKIFGKNLHPHLFRRSFCTNYIHQGMPIAAVSKLMGHYGNEALRTTLTNYYCPMDDAYAEKVYQKFEKKFMSTNLDANRNSIIGNQNI